MTKLNRKLIEANITNHNETDKAILGDIEVINKGKVAYTILDSWIPKSCIIQDKYIEAWFIDRTVTEAVNRIKGKVKKVTLHDSPVTAVQLTLDDIKTIIALSNGKFSVHTHNGYHVINGRKMTKYLNDNTNEQLAEVSLIFEESLIDLLNLVLYKDGFTGITWDNNELSGATITYDKVDNVFNVRYRCVATYFDKHNTLTEAIKSLAKFSEAQITPHRINASQLRQLAELGSKVELSLHLPKKRECLGKVYVAPKGAEYTYAISHARKSMESFATEEEVITFINSLTQANDYALLVYFELPVNGKRTNYHLIKRDAYAVVGGSVSYVNDSPKFDTLEEAIKYIVTDNDKVCRELSEDKTEEQPEIKPCDITEKQLKSLLELADSGIDFSFKNLCYTIRVIGMEDSKVRYSLVAEPNTYVAELIGKTSEERSLDLYSMFSNSTIDTIRFRISDREVVLTHDDSNQYKLYMQPIIGSGRSEIYFWYSPLDIILGHIKLCLANEAELKEANEPVEFTETLTSYVDDVMSLVDDATGKTYTEQQAIRFNEVTKQLEQAINNVEALIREGNDND